MSVLFAIWVASLSLSGLALLCMTTLIVLRIVRGWKNTRDSATKATMTRALLLAAEGLPSPLLERRMSAREQHAFVEAGIALLDLVRGATGVRIVEMLARGGALAVLKRWLKSANPERRATAAEVLVYFAPAREHAVLTHALNDRDHDVRVAAAVSLIRLGAAPPVVELIALLGRHGRPSARLAQVFETIFAKHPADVLTLARSDELDSFARAKAIEVVAASGDLSVVPALQELASASDPDIRTAAIRGLGRLAHPSSRAKIAEAFGDGEWFVRAAAAEAAGKIGLYELAPALTALADDSVWWVRFRAAEALEVLDEAGRSALRRVAGHASAEREIAPAPPAASVGA